MKPRISVIVPVYNSERFFKKTLDSILDQRYPAHEVIVIDLGGSYRKLSQALKELCERRGPQAKKYIELLLSSVPKGEAADDAEIDPKTGRSYLTEFTMLVQDKAPPKTTKRKLSKNPTKKKR